MSSVFSDSVSPVSPYGVFEYSRQLSQRLASEQPFDTVVPVLDAMTNGQPMTGHVVMGQINPAVGDLAGNAKRMARYMKAAEYVQADLLVFPELALMGYPIGDVITRHPFLVEENLKWLQVLAEQAGKTRVLVGFVEPVELNRGKPFYNSLAVLGEGCVERIIRKKLLPTYGEFYDVRTFEPGDITPKSVQDTIVTSAHDPARRYGVSVCEDIWNDADYFERPLYADCPIQAQMAVESPPTVLINVSASPSRSRKEQLKHHLLSHVAQKHQVPLVYVNQVGAIDEISFDGASRVYSAQGELIARAPAFEDSFLLVNPIAPAVESVGESDAETSNLTVAEPTHRNAIYHLPLGLEKTLAAEKQFDAYDESDLGRTYASLVQGIRDYFKKTGFTRAVLGLSGGLDSAVTVVLLADALGAENVLGGSMPSALTSDDSNQDAQTLASNLGIRYTVIPIAQATDAFEYQLKQVEPSIQPIWGEPSANSFARDNVQAMSRATWLRLLGNEYRAFPVATSDKSEFYMGYTTVNGDMSGALAPLGDVPKTKVRLLARWLNAHRAKPNAIPEQVITKPSGAELAIDPKTGKTLTAEDALMPYEFADEVIWRIETLKQSKTQMLTEVFQWEKSHELSAEKKREWLDRFFSRMAMSVFKWWLSPPAIIVEGNGSITKTDYRHPITANRMCWDTQSLDAMRLQLNP